MTVRCDWSSSSKSTYLLSAIHTISCPALIEIIRGGELDKDALGELAC